jgi:rubrerythrin
MPPHKLIAIEPLGVGIRAEIKALEVYTQLASSVPNRFRRHKITLLAKEELQHKRILEEAYKAQSSEVPLLLPTSQIPKNVACQTDRARLSVSEVSSCSIKEEHKTRQFRHESAQRVVSIIGGKANHPAAGLARRKSFCLSSRGPAEVVKVPP